jgi:hypothetical protein
MKELEFECASVVGKGKGDVMNIKKRSKSDDIMFQSVQPTIETIRVATIYLSKKDSLKLATTIINEFCGTENQSKKVLKARIALKDSNIEGLTRLVELKDERIKILEQNLKESKTCIDDLTDLNL